MYDRLLEGGSDRWRDLTEISWVTRFSICVHIFMHHVCGCGMEKMYDRLLSKEGGGTK